MAAWSKIRRGPVDRTTPITHEAPIGSAVTALLPGMLVVLDATGSAVRKASEPGEFPHVVGEHLYGNIDEDLVARADPVRLFTPQSGELYAIRAVAGITLVDDMPLVSNASGLAEKWVAATHEFPPVCFVDAPASESPNSAGRVTVAGELIPVKFK